MKVIVAVILALGSVSALGSGPYLPSGWKPQGPAFYLPGEVQKPADSPLKETIIFDTQASGSDSLREYGPPKTQEVNVISQSLPDVVTEQTFLIVEDKGAISALVVEEISASEGAELNSEIVQEATTETQYAEEISTEAIQSIADIELQTDITTVSYDDIKYEEIQAVTELIKSEEIQVTESVKAEEVEATVVSVEERLGQVVVEEVKNIAEAVVNLESEIKAEQVQSVEASAEVKLNQEGSGSAQVPEGFLEYGPPGFREYGPPKGDILLGSAAVIQEPSNAVSFESNEARRRRFSPKFRAPKNKRIH